MEDKPYVASKRDRQSRFTLLEMRVIDAITRRLIEKPEEIPVARTARVLGIQNNVFTRARQNILEIGVPFRMKPQEASRQPFEDRARNERHLGQIAAEVMRWLPNYEYVVEEKPKAGKEGAPHEITEVDDILKTAGDVSQKRRRLLEIARHATSESVRVQAELAEDRLARAHAEVDKGPGEPLTITDQINRLSMLMRACGAEISAKAMNDAFEDEIQVHRYTPAEQARRATEERK